MVYTISAFVHQNLMRGFRVEETVRQRIFLEALKTYSWPLGREEFNQVAVEFLRRIPAEAQRTIGEVLGWREKRAQQLRFYDKPRRN
jgi:hypothetical protein